MTNEINETTEERVLIRDEKGRFAKGKSGNRRGRPKGSKGKFAKQRMENDLNKMGPLALKMLMENAQKLMEQGKLESGSRILVAVLDKWYQLTIYNDRVTLEQQKDKRKAKEAASEMDDEEEFTPVTINFPTFGS